MKQLITTILDHLRQDERVVLVSILKAEGSVPRGVGARMAVFADGSTLDTVGGGELERRAALRAGELLRLGRGEIGRYVLHPGRESDLGMVCGGEVLLGFACFCPQDAAQQAALESILRLLDGPGSGWLVTRYASDGSTGLTVLDGSALHDAAPEALCGQPTLRECDEWTELTEPLAKNETVWLFGGGHVGRALVPTLAAVGFAVTVYDERPELSQPERFPLARRVLCGPYAELLNRVQIRPEDYVIVMTPGHRADYEVLRQALQTKACYIGCIGSKKKVAFVNNRLRESGYSAAEIARIHAPIGLPILAQTPEEIAVSIAAQLILHRHGGEAAEKNEPMEGS